MPILDSNPATPGKTADMANIHRCDQRAATIDFEHKNIVSSNKEFPHKVSVAQCGANSDKFVGNTSSVLWPVAVHASNYMCEKFGDEKTAEVKEMIFDRLSSLNSQDSKKLTAIEIGAGIGLLGTVSAHLPQSFEKVVLTDQSIELLETNREMQGEEVKNRLDVRKCLWGDDNDISSITKDFGEFDIVLASDVIFPGNMDIHSKNLMNSLVSTIKKLMKKDGRALIAYEFRDCWWTTSTFVESCESAGFNVESERLEDDEDTDFLMYILTLVDEDSMVKKTGVAKEESEDELVI